MAVLIDRSRERTQHAKKFRRSAAHVRFFASSSRESGDGFSQNREEEGVRVLEARARLKPDRAHPPHSPVVSEMLRALPFVVVLLIVTSNVTFDAPGGDAQSLGAHARGSRAMVGGDNCVIIFTTKFCYLNTIELVALQQQNFVVLKQQILSSKNNKICCSKTTVLVVLKQICCFVTTYFVVLNIIQVYLGMIRYD